MKRRLSILGLMYISILSFIAQSAESKAVYSIESPLVAGTFADVAYRITDADGQPINKAKGQLVDEKGNVITTFATDENGQGLFFFVPKMCRYKVQWIIEGNEFTTDFLSVKDSGYVWSIDNISNATYVPFDPKHPFWNPIEKDSLSDIELEQLSKMWHKKVLFDNTPPHTFITENHKEHTITTNNNRPVNWERRQEFYIFNKHIIQGENKPQERNLSCFFHPQDVSEEVRVWVERPENITGDSLFVAIYRGDKQIGIDAVDMRQSELSCLCFPLGDIPQGEIEFRIFDNQHRLLATRNINASRYMYKKLYKDARKTDLDIRLRNGIVYPMITSANWKMPKNSGLKICFTPECGSLIAGNRSQIAFSAMDDDGNEVAIDGEVYSSKDSLQTRFSSWTPRGGSFFLKPEQGETYYAVVNYNGKRYKAVLPESKNDGWSLGVDCLTRIDRRDDSEISVAECIDRNNYWSAFWSYGGLYDKKYFEPENSTPAYEYRTFISDKNSKQFFEFEIPNFKHLSGKYIPKQYAEIWNNVGGNIDYDKIFVFEDDIRIRLINKNHSNNLIEIRLTDDCGKIIDYQRCVMDRPEIWLRFPIDENTPEGHLNVVVITKEGDELCRRCLQVSHYSKHRDYSSARMHDINNILGQRRYETATLIE